MLLWWPIYELLPPLMKLKFLRKIGPDKGTLKIAGRFVAEFSVPFAIAALWTGWEWNKSTENYDVLSKGAIHFFAAGWGFSQWNRIKKQKKSEDGLGNVQQNIESLISKLNTSTTDLLGNVTGGDSFCELRPILLNPLIPRDFELIHHGDHPLYDVQVRIVDLARFEAVPRSISQGENIYEFNVLPPQHAIKIELKSPQDNIRSLPRRLNVFVTARNGSFEQLLQIVVVGGKQQSASQIIRGGDIIWMAVDREFPRSGHERVDWSLHDEDKKFRINRDIT
jgi:hypothetical protein